MEIFRSSLGTLVLACFALLLSAPASSGFFDELVDKAKQTTQETYEKALDATLGSEKEAEQSPPPSTSQTSGTLGKPVYDRALVRDIQTQLNAVGINVGTADGIYGKGTKAGIEKFQRQQGVTVDGVPSAALLTSLKSANTGSTKIIGSGSAGASRPTQANVERAVLHFAPEALNSESWLRRAVNNIYPDESRQLQNDEFAWNQRKASFKQRILAEIKNPVRTFGMTPWEKPNSHRWILGDYDFGRKAFQIKLSKLNLQLGAYDPRPAEMAIRKHIRWLPMDAASADQLVKSGKLGPSRELYPKFTYTIIGVDKRTKRGELSLSPKVAIKKIDLYALTARGSSLSTNTYEPVTTLSLKQTSIPPKTQPTKVSSKTADSKKSALAAPVAKTSAPEAQKGTSTPSKVVPTKPGSSDPYLRANTNKPFGPDVVGLKLGMTIDEAETLIRKRKAVMNVIDGKPPHPFSKAKLFVLEPGDEFIGLMTLPMESGDRIASIERSVYFHPDESPSQTAIASSVEKKYGKPSYVYEVKGQFNRRWYFDPQGAPSERPNHETRACEYALAGTSHDVWLLEDGKSFQWTMPWPVKAYMGASNAPAVGNHNSLDTDAVNECGPAINARYENNAGMLTGPRLRVHVYDPAWVIADHKKSEAADAQQGAKELDL